MIFKSQDGPSIVLTADALSNICIYISECAHVETGGILIGEYSTDLTTAYIDIATGPGSYSKHAIRSFIRRQGELQEILDDAVDAGLYYLGEWHCHPNDDCKPSRRDLSQLLKIAHSKKYGCPEPILIIISEQYPRKHLSAHIANQNIIVSYWIKSA